MIIRNGLLSLAVRLNIFLLVTASVIFQVIKVLCLFSLALMSKRCHSTILLALITLCNSDLRHLLVMLPKLLISKTDLLLIEFKTLATFTNSGNSLTLTNGMMPHSLGSKLVVDTVLK